MSMGGEVYNLMVDWCIAVASLLYSYGVGMAIAQGTTRLLAIFPVICLFLYLPLNLKTISFAGPTSFFLSWLGSFKLILFAFGQGPLSSSPLPNLPLSHFIATACLPINIVVRNDNQNPSHQFNFSTKKSNIDYSPRLLLLFLVTTLYRYKDYLHPLLIMCLISYYFAFMLILFLASTAFVVRTLLGVELKPQFNEPHHATSVQNFWGKRWNLMVSEILRLTVYRPARAIFSHLVSERWVSVPAVFVTFLVSGIMHEMIFYYLGQFKPTWEVTWYFIIHGVWVGTEIVMKKKMVRLKSEHPPGSIVAWLLTLTFVTVTSFWLFFPPFLRLDPCDRVCKEAMAFVRFLKHGHLLSPDDNACSFT